jgi:hypothetical protein
MGTPNIIQNNYAQKNVFSYNSNELSNTQILENDINKASLFNHQTLDFQKNIYHLGIPETSKAQNQLSNSVYNPSTNISGHYVDFNSLKNQFNMPIQTASTTQATTAYLVQTSNGSALLIPPQNLLRSNHIISSTGNKTLNRNNYEINNVQKNDSLASKNNKNNNEIHSNSNSNFLNITDIFGRSDSTTSTNVYQTIDADK